MTDHSPALIAAAKAIELRMFGYDHPDDRICAALCEALSTTPPSEEAMKPLPDATVTPMPLECPECGKPEPTEDHYRRRACSTLGLFWADYVSGKVSLFEGQAVRTVARLLAERDAMQARVEGWQPIETAPQDHTHVLLREDDGAIYRGYILDMEEDGPLWASVCGQYVTTAPEPTHWMPLPDEPSVASVAAEPIPDPDLVLAREAAAQVADEKGWPQGSAATMAPAMEAAALRGLKLKGQAHE
jgi:hypothetical protein